MKLTASIFLFMGFLLYGQNNKIKVLEAPQYNCVETKYIELKEIKSLDEDLNDKIFIYKPYSLVVDAFGYIYVFDTGQGSIVKFNKDLKPIATIGRKGQGPGEFGAQGIVELTIRKERIYAGDRVNKRITQFDTNGRILSESNIPIPDFGYIDPITDSQGNYYLISKTNLIDKYNPKGLLLKKILSKDELCFSLFYAPYSSCERYYLQSFPTSNAIACSDDDQLLVLLPLNGKYYLLKNDKVIKSKYLWPKEALAMYQKEAKGKIKNRGQRFFFRDIILDYDGNDCFYAHVTGLASDIRRLLYEFDFSGNLKRVLYFNENPETGYTQIYFKRHGLFYAIGMNRRDGKNLIIYKEKE